MGKLSDKDMDEIEKWIGREPKTFTLLYSITRDGCNAPSFHSKCNSAGPTVTVLYNAQGSVYGGYTGVSWTSRGAYATDSAAFLYRLYLNGKPAPVKFPREDNSNNDIYDGSSYGPTFGGGHILHTFSGTINISGGTFPLNGHVNVGNNGYYDMRNVQLGDINNGTMVVTELEVYKVSDGERRPRLEKPWRKTPEWNRELLLSLVDEVASFQGLEEAGVDKANVLLVGPVGAGKSSFINTVTSIMLDSIIQPARCGSAEQSLTTAYRQHTLTTKSDELLNVRLCDTRGLEEDQGLDVIEMEYLLAGHIPNFYEFHPVSPISHETPGFIEKPSQSDKIHCVAFVFDATTLDVIPGKVIQKMKSFLTRLNQKGIPSVVLLTKVDKVCQDVESDVSQVFKSMKVKDEMEKAADSFGLPRINILPIKNYENEMMLEDDISILTLLSLKQILHFAKVYMKLLSEKIAAVKITSNQNTKS